MKAKTDKRPAGQPSGDVDPRFAPVIAAFAKHQDVSQKRMFSSKSVLSVNGKIFAMFARDRFVAKLPRARVDALVEGGRGEYFDPGHGRLMKEWVAIEGRATSWIALATEAYEFVRSKEPRAGARASS